MNAIRLPFSIWWLRWLLFARFSLMLPSLCWLAGWMAGWLADWHCCCNCVPRFVRNSLLCLVSVVMPLFRPQLNNPNQSSPHQWSMWTDQLVFYMARTLSGFFLLSSTFSFHFILDSIFIVLLNAMHPIFFAITVGHAHSFGIVFRFAVLMHHRVYVWIGIMLSSLGFLTKQIFLSKLAHFILFFLFLFFFFCLILLLFRCCFSPFLSFFLCMSDSNPIRKICAIL